jgi:hypothetical protein
LYRKPYPKRENRKLPAHLADPNFISLEEEGAKLPEKTPESRRPSTQLNVGEEQEDEVAGNEGSGDDDDEDYTEDDPNR